jgi:hypothetical protein
VSIDTKQAIAEATRAQYYGRETPWQFHLSYKIERGLERLARLLERHRKAMVRRAMKEMWPIDQRVMTNRGPATVIKNRLLYNTFGMGGWIETDVRYDTPAEQPSHQQINDYPYIGHYNQIFLERL